jgi:hypothetical protein
MSTTDEEAAALLFGHRSLDVFGEGIWFTAVLAYTSV